ncbi:SDR family NAD(P)-dependent oxidoreductase [Novosphingobium sp. Chol11]|uniref:SDR family NAD(P)-dependent oxidoreductase n=1 Tax=Novosphingobium sp. Chol11 TaxID=1385763 RepID=UPI0025E3E364|nr:glucose 1-dehydrogenase [Novosphingobium sp. Chol11]
MNILDAFRLDGEVAVVTGGGKGIGRGIAIGLAQAGAAVVVASRTQSDLDEVVAAIAGMGGKALAVVTDATDKASLENLGQKAAAHFGSITIWVNNAGGIPDATPRYLVKTSEASWDAMMDLNLKAVWMGAVVAANHMRDDGGAIVNISSRAAMGPQVKNAPYGAAKAAVNSLTASLAGELAPKIRVNAVAPGPVLTQNFEECLKIENDEQRAAVLELMGIPLKRYGRTDDIAAAVLFLASPASSWISGQCLYVSGGR